MYHVILDMDLHYGFFTVYLKSEFNQGPVSVLGNPHCPTAQHTSTPRTHTQCREKKGVDTLGRPMGVLALPLTPSSSPSSPLSLLQWLPSHRETRAPGCHLSTPTWSAHSLAARQTWVTCSKVCSLSTKPDPMGHTLDVYFPTIWP